MDRLNFCTAGVPLCVKDRSTEKGIVSLTELGLDGMEMEFVRGVNMGAEKALAVGKMAAEKGKVLTAHAPYYINLNSKEKRKITESIERIRLTAERASQAGAWSICFHPGFTMGDSPEKAYAAVKAGLTRLFSQLDDAGISLWVRPETTGKESQFGSLKELLRLSQNFERMMPCIDFSHMHARSAGKYNTREEFRETLESVEKALGRKALDTMHIHLSGINYSQKGERNHLNLEESDMRWRELLAVWKDFRIRGVVICESPNIEGDALLMKRTYAGL